MRPEGTNIYNGSTEYYYAVKHNPMEFFTDTQDQNVYPLAQLWTDLTNNAAGRYNWITPDEFNEMHNYLPNGFYYQNVQYTGDQAAIAEGDNCLATIIPIIMASPAYQDDGVIILWTDETESTDDTNTALPEIIISPMARGNAYASSVVMSHSSDLKTMDEIFGLAFQNAAVAAANDLSDMFQVPCEGPVILWSFTNLMLSTVSNNPVLMMNVTGTNYILAREGCNDGVLTITQTPPPDTPLAAGTTNQVVIAISGWAGKTVYSTNWIIVTNVTEPKSLAGNGRTNTFFHGAKMHGTDDFQLRFSGPRGHRYQILASEDLAKPKSEWRAISGGIFGSTNAIFTDHVAHFHARRFYIIKSP
jgi:hypothetical protein